MKIQTICVCGAGTMGSGIAQVAAAGGFKTILYELNEGVLAKAQERLQQDLQKLVSKQKITAEESAALYERILFTSDIKQCVADLVIEAIIEKPEVKLSLFEQLAEINHTLTILASNTSSLSINALSEHIPHPERFAGLHFFNPAPVMKLVEVVKSEQTNEVTMDTLVAITKQLGKTPVVCTDSPGFIVNRVARPYYIEALRLAEEGYTDFELMDTLLESRGFKMGPFKLMDLIGNDVNYAVSCSVYEQMGRPERLKPSYIQQRKVEEGALGRKSGKGYYEY